MSMEFLYERAPTTLQAGDVMVLSYDTDPPSIRRHHFSLELYRQGKFIVMGSNRIIKNMIFESGDESTFSTVAVLLAWAASLEVYVSSRPTSFEVPLLYKHKLICAALFS
jgi:hypothetical protein